jgi:hypothetical protein
LAPYTFPPTFSHHVVTCVWMLRFAWAAVSVFSMFTPKFPGKTGCWRASFHILHLFKAMACLFCVTISCSIFFLNWQGYINYVSVICQQHAIYDYDISVVNTVLWQGVKEIVTEVAPSPFEPSCLWILRTSSLTYYPDTLDYRVLLPCTFIVQYITLVQGRGTAPITVKDQQNIF